MNIYAYKPSRMQNESAAAISDEVLRARTKFPRNNLLTIALGEEYGELCKAQLQRRPRAEIVREAIQVAALAVRIIEEGDSNFDNVTDAEAKL